MDALRRARRPLCAASLAAFTVTVAPVPAAQAAMVDTNTIVTQSERAAARDRVAGFMSRADVQAQMERLGVSPAEAQARVASLSDAEIAKIAGRLDTMPAGQSLLGVVLIVLVVIIVLDVLT